MTSVNCTLRRPIIEILENRQVKSWWSFFIWGLGVENKCHVLEREWGGEETGTWGVTVLQHQPAATGKRKTTVPFPPQRDGTQLLSTTSWRSRLSRAKTRDDYSEGRHVDFPRQTQRPGKGTVDHALGGSEFMFNNPSTPRVKLQGKFHSLLR